jgi:hypothetical protein
MATEDLQRRITWLAPAPAGLWIDIEAAAFVRLDEASLTMVRAQA